MSGQRAEGTFHDLRRIHRTRPKPSNAAIRAPGTAEHLGFRYRYQGSNLGRAERLAPEPSVICLWRHPGMARMDEWEVSFRTDDARRDPAFQATRLAIHFKRGGLYDEIIGGEPLGKGLHYVEFFAAGEEHGD